MRTLTLFIFSSFLSTNLFASYFAELDSNKTVKRVIVSDKQFIDSGVVGNPSNWVETFKGDNYAGVGYKYDEESNIFIPKKPYNSWIFNKNKLSWEPPVKQKEEKVGFIQVWDEPNKKWNYVDEKDK